MKEKKFYLQASDLGKEQVNTQKIVFEWNIIYDCNYRCSYCFFDGKWEEYKKRNVYLSVNEWLKIWENIYFKYGNCFLIITGGEPFIYPNFVMIINEISKIHYPINISTNASKLSKEIIEKLNLEKISLTLSFQPEYDDLRSIIEKLKLLKQKSGRKNSTINFVAYPPFLDRLEEYISYVIDNGEELKVIPFIGEYNNKKYPENYTVEEKKLLGIDDNWKNNVYRKTKLCSAGCKSALILPDGKVVRCGQIGEKFIIGNIFDDKFKLLEESLPCEAEMCPCIEFV